MNKLYFLVIALMTGSVYADVPAAQRNEVDHLIHFVKTTSCKMNRNGQYHDAAAALAHIQKKYDYFRNKISTTEQFIELSATKSTVSGHYYTVKCGNAPPLRAQDWLLRELKKYRRDKRTS